MSLSKHTTHLNRFTLKVLAVICGYGLWSTVSTYQSATVTTTIPLCFYNSQKNRTVQAPDTVSVTVYGKRKDLFLLHTIAAAHYDAACLNEGTQRISIQKEQVTLPESVRLVHYTPTMIDVTVTKKVS